MHVRVFVYDLAYPTLPVLPDVELLKSQYSAISDSIQAIPLCSCFARPFRPLHARCRRKRKPPFSSHITPKITNSDNNKSVKKSNPFRYQYIDEKALHSRFAREVKEKSLSDNRLVDELTALFRRAAAGGMYMRFAHEITDSTANCHTMPSATDCEPGAWALSYTDADADGSCFSQCLPFDVAYGDE
jgi:hypothetical protein